MRPTRTVAAAFVAAAIPLYAGSATPAPLSQSQALKSADVGTFEQVQYRRGYRDRRAYRGRWIGPAAGVAAGLAFGSAVAAAPYAGGYYAYGSAPSAYAAAVPSAAYGPGYTGPQWYWGYGADAPSPGSSAVCTPDREDNSAFPSWLCR